MSRCDDDGMSWKILKSSRFDEKPLFLFLSISVTLSRPSRERALFVCADSYICEAKLFFASACVCQERVKIVAKIERLSLTWNCVLINGIECAFGLVVTICGIVFEVQVINRLHVSCWL